MRNKYNLKTLITGASLALCLASCNPLGIEPTTMVDEGRFWENSALSRSYVNQFYLWSPTTGNDKFTSDQWSDDGIGWLDGQYNDFRQTEFTHRIYDANNNINAFSISSIWTTAYKQIRAVNLGLERISTSKVLDSKAQQQLLAECYFFRAWCYFELEQYFGTVPYLDKTLTSADETMIPRITREALFDNMLGDLNESIRLFEESGATPLVGMVNINAARTFKSRVALYAACAADASAKNLYNEGQSANLFKFTKAASVYYQMAFDAAGAVLDKYTLEPEYSTLFTSEAVSTKESIWPKMFNLSVGGFNPTSKLGPLGSYYDSDLSWDLWGGVFPTQDLVDCYYQQDTKDGHWKQWWKTQQATEGMNGTVDADGNFSGTAENYRSLLYDRRDDRFYATITYDGSYLCPEDKQTTMMYNVQTWIDDDVADGKEFKYSALHTGYRYTTRFQISDGRANTYTGYYLRKYAHYDKFDESGKLNREQRTTCFYMIRYAEVLLNYAEAAIKLNHPELAKPRIQEIRTRAGITEEFDEAVVGHNLWEEYKLQRHLEFAFEIPGHRYYDLLRWSESEGKSTIEELNRGPKAMRIFRKGVEYDAEDATDLEKKQIGYPVAVNGKGYFVPRIQTLRYDYEEHLKKFNNSRYYFFPILQTTMTGYIGLTQNPGWEDFSHE